MFPRYLQYLLTDFRQTFVTGASRDRDELIRFWDQKVKGLGHSMTEYIPDFHVSTISPVSIDRFSPNFCHWSLYLVPVSPLVFFKSVLFPNLTQPKLNSHDDVDIVDYIVIFRKTELVISCEFYIICWFFIILG